MAVLFKLKGILSLLFFCVFVPTSRTYAQQSERIQFFKGNWSELLSVAHKARKPVFVDVYTDWCIPCKQMEKEIFTLPEVARFYNANFICYQLNAEKGEGPKLARSYGVQAYPTWLFLDGNGTLRNKMMGYMSEEDFIAIAKTALEQGDQAKTLAAFDAEFAAGKRELGFLRDYLEIRSTLKLENASLLNAYIEARGAQPLLQEELSFLLSHLGRTWSAAIPIVATYLNTLQDPQKSEYAERFFNETLYFVWGDAAKSGDRALADQAMRMAWEVYPVLNEARQLNCAHTALYHCRKFLDTAGLKKAGYLLAGKQMQIDPNELKQKDKRSFDQLMAPFLSGEQDSTKIPGFAEEKQMIANQFSAKTAGLLYEAAEGFDEILPADDPSRKDAILWAEKAYILLPSPHTEALLKKLKANK